MKGGEVFVPKLPSYNILQLAKCIGPECKIKIIGKRPGEKLHEAMISTSESYRTLIQDDYYVVVPEINISSDYSSYGTTYMKDESEYSSGENVLISDEELLNLVISN